MQVEEYIFSNLHYIRFKLIFINLARDAIQILNSRQNKIENYFSNDEIWTQGLPFQVECRVTL